MSERSSNHRFPRILVVDDEEFIRDLIGQFFTRSDYFVATAHSGASGIAQCRAGRFDIALVDFKMPGQNGMEVLDGLRSIDPNLPMIMLTGYATMDTSIEAVRHGAHEVIAKPFRLSELKGRIDHALSTRSLSQHADQMREVLTSIDVHHAPHREAEPVSN